MSELAENGRDFAVSFDPADSTGPPTPEPQWLELLASGLTFDLHGLAPGPATGVPPHTRSVSLAEDLVHRVEAVTLRPGPHLSEGVGMIPVVRTLAWLTTTMCRLDGVRAVAWHPAHCWSSPEIFCDSVRRWVEGGVFPGLTLATLAQSPDGGLQSLGLALFTGQELRLEPEVAEDRAEATKLAVRLLDFLIERGRVTAAEAISGQDGTRLRLQPSANGRFVRVCRA